MTGDCHTTRQRPEPRRYPLLQSRHLRVRLKCGPVEAPLFSLGQLERPRSTGVENPLQAIQVGLKTDGRLRPQRKVLSACFIRDFGHSRLTELRLPGVSPQPSDARGIARMHDHAVSLRQFFMIASLKCATEIALKGRCVQPRPGDSRTGEEL
jgi:hypothetical protein